MAGRSDEIKQYLLGIHVFDRRPDYDPGLDPIVRVEARRLRSKLETYYQTAGRNARVRIELPKGAYIPRFGSPDVPHREIASALAVLPISNSSRHPDHDSLCEGITQEIIHAITRATRLRVVAWQYSARLPVRELEISSVGHELGVSHVLCGALRVGGARIRLLAHLIETSNGEYTWSECYDRTLVDLFDTVRECSDAIVPALQIQLGVANWQSAPEAYTLKPNERMTELHETEMKNGLDFQATFEPGTPKFAGTQLTTPGIADPSRGPDAIVGRHEGAGRPVQLVAHL
jgi:serine/threonine-protein kinase